MALVSLPTTHTLICCCPDFLQVQHPSVAQLVAVAAHSFTANDLLRVERILLDALDFNVTSTTAYGFLHLLTQVSNSCQIAVLCAAAEQRAANRIDSASMTAYGFLHLPTYVSNSCKILAAVHSAAQQQAAKYGGSNSSAADSFVRLLI